MSFVKQHTIEELNELSETFLRNLDVRSKEEEIILQAVLDSKMKTAPIENMPQLTIQEQKMLDDSRLTPEIEKEIQDKLDARRAIWRSKITGEDAILVENGATDTLPQMSVETPIKLEAQALNKFCEHCDAKGPIKHKKNCVR